MSADKTCELQFRALGRILDRRAQRSKDFCILQVGEGFVVHMLSATSALAGPAFAPTTITIEASELKAAMDELAQPPAVSKGETGGLKWFNRG